MSSPPPAYDKHQEAQGQGAGGFASPPMYQPGAPGQGYNPGMPGQGYNPGTNRIMIMQNTGFGKDPVTTTCNNCQAHVSRKT